MILQPQRVRLTLVAAVLLAAPLAAQDVLVLTDGSRRAGSVQACTEERCVVGGAPVARAEIAWVGLATGDAPPPAGAAAAQDALHLADGTVVSGPVLGISLGVVATETESYERERVRWVRFAGTLTAPVEDLLVLAGGGRQSGTLQGCTGDGCTLGGRHVERERIRWIGFATGEASPPGPQDPAAGEVHRRDGEVVAGELVGVDDAAVTTDRARYGRAEVVWVYVPPPRQDPSDQAYGAPPDREGKPREDDPPPPPPPPPPAGGSGSFPGTTGEAERGALWTGTCQAHMTSTSGGDTIQWATQIEVRLREYRFPLLCAAADGRGLSRSGTFIRLEPEGSVVTTSIRCSGGGICSGQGTVTVSAGLDEPDIGHPSAIWLNATDHPLRSCADFEVPAGPGVYQFGVGVRNSQELTVNWQGGETTTAAYFTPMVGGADPAGIGCGDPERRFLESANGVMRGTYTSTCPSGPLVVSWSVCREGAECPPPPPMPGQGGPSPPSEDDCGDLSVQQALLDNLADQRRDTSNQLDTVIAEFQAEWNAAQALRPEFEALARDCNLWETSKLLMELLLAAGASTGGNTERGLEALDKLLSVISGLQSGTPGWLIEIEGDPLSDQLLDQAWNAVMAEVQRSGEGELQTLRRELDSCLGTPMTLDETVQDARRFLRHYENATAKFPRWRQLLSTLFHQDLERWNKLNDMYRRCLEWAECKGLDPATACTPPPAAP